MIDVRGLFRCLIVLKDSADRRRLRMAFDLVRRAELRTLFVQLMAHTTFRWRLRQLGADTDQQGVIAPVDESDAPVEYYHEGPWPTDTPIVSVIVPCFNYGAFVTEAVDSVLAQTFQNLEIIIVEGGSTDGISRQTVTALRRPKTTALFRDKPCRVGDNRNFGIRHARGKYICCLDADDALEPTYIEKALFLLEHCGGDVVSTSVKRFGAIKGGYGVLPHPDLSDMLEGNHVSTCAVFRRSLWELAGGFQDTDAATPFVHEDWRFWVRLAALGARILNISGEQLFRYRAHAQASLSNRPGVAPNAMQAADVRELNRDVITPDAYQLSTSRATTRVQSLDGLANLIRPTDSAPAILLALPHLVLGGAERLLSQIVAGLHRSGLRVVIVTTLPTWPHLGDTTSWFEPATSEIYHLPRFLPHARWTSFIDYLLCAKRVRAVLLAGSVYFYEIIPGLKEKYPELRIVDLLFNAVAHTDNNRRMGSLLDLTLVESEQVRSWLLARHGTPERISLVRSGIDLERFHPISKPPAALQHLNFPPGAFIVGFAGRLAEEKAPLSFIRIASLMPANSPVQFAMIGTGPLEDKIRGDLQRSGLGERFCFAGMVDDSRDYLGCYDVLVLPSVIDGRPTVVMEALAMGIPVIASDVGSLPEMVVHGETGFLCAPTDFRSFALHIQWLHEHPEDYAAMRRNARQFAEEHFGVEPMISAYVGIFRKMTAPHPDRLRSTQDACRLQHVACQRETVADRSSEVAQGSLSA